MTEDDMKFGNHFTETNREQKLRGTAGVDHFCSTTTNAAARDFQYSVAWTTSVWKGVAAECWEDLEKVSLIVLFKPQDADPPSLLKKQCFQSRFELMIEAVAAFCLA